MSSTRHTARDRPGGLGTGERAAETCHRVKTAVGSPAASLSTSLRQRRRRKAVLPEPSAAQTLDDGLLLGGRVLRLRPRFHELVERAPRQPAPGQVLVENLDPERDGRTLRPRGTVESDDPASKLRQSLVVPGMGHALL